MLLRHRMLQCHVGCLIGCDAAFCMSRSNSCCTVAAKAFLTVAVLLTSSAIRSRSCMDLLRLISDCSPDPALSVPAAEALDRSLRGAAGAREAGGAGALVCWGVSVATLCAAMGAEASIWPAAAAAATPSSKLSATEMSSSLWLCKLGVVVSGVAVLSFATSALAAAELLAAASAARSLGSVPSSPLAARHSTVPVWRPESKTLC